MKKDLDLDETGEINRIPSFPPFSPVTKVDDEMNETKNKKKDSP